MKIFAFAWFPPIDPGEKKRPGFNSQARKTCKHSSQLRRPGDHDRFLGFRPVALRRRFSPALPFRFLLYQYHITFWKSYHISYKTDSYTLIGVVNSGINYRPWALIELFSLYGSSAISGKGSEFWVRRGAKRPCAPKIRVSSR